MGLFFKKTSSPPAHKKALFCRPVPGAAAALSVGEPEDGPQMTVSSGLLSQSNFPYMDAI
jgi:hypothetical protein